MTTWQKMIAILVGIVFGVIVGYICLKPHVEEFNSMFFNNTENNNVFDQYVDGNNKSNNNSIETRQEEIVTP